MKALPAEEYTPVTLPLEGIRVLSVTGVWAGPHAEQLLADWGAEVIRVESTQFMQPNTRGRMVNVPPDMPRIRKNWGMGYPDWDPGKRPWNRFAIFQSHARNKLSMTVDARRPEGLEIVHRLLQISDVFMENNVPETIEKLHLTYKDLVQVRPDLVMLRMPAYGLSGPYKNYRSFGAHLECTVGHTYIRGYPDMDASVREDSYVGDAAAGQHGALAVMMALRHRRRTGQGQLIEFSQAENVLPYLGEAFMDYTMNGRIQETLGNRHRAHAPQQAYACRGDDAWVVLSVANDGEWRGLRRALGEPAWCGDPMFATSLGRWKHQDEIDGHITEWTRDRTPWEAARALQAEGVRAGPVLNEKDLYEDPQLNAQRFFKVLSNEDAGTHSYPGLMWSADETPNEVRTPPCRLGEHNEYVYKGLLATDGDTYRKLEQTGHIGMDFAGHLV